MAITTTMERAARRPKPEVDKALANRLHAGPSPDARIRGGLTLPGSSGQVRGPFAVGAVFALLVLFNLALPKGGIRAGDFPVTWGYVLLAAVAPFAGANLLRRRNLSLQPIIQTGLFLPIAAGVLIKAEAYGLAPGEWVPFLIIFGVFPVLVLGLLSHYLEDIEAERLARLLRLALRFAVVWGLANFFLHLVTKQFIEIPYITVNGDEVGETLSKNNMRSGVMKLVSTYNNGNIFGVCMVMLSPVYFLVEKKRAWVAAFVLAVLLSLSRTAWFGLMAAFILMVLGGQIRLARAYVWVGIAGAIASLLLILPLLGWSGANIIDSSLGGRMDYFDNFQITLLGAREIRIPELIYAGILQSFGVLGLVIALAALAAGPLYGVLNWGRLSPLRRAATIGALAYLAEAAIDGALIFPPTFVLFLFVTSLIYRRGFRPAALTQGVPASGRSRMRSIAQVR